MSAIIKPRIGSDRTPLQNVIPLSTPYLVFLDPSDLCNARCEWCPTGSGKADLYRTSQRMDAGLYLKILDDLSDMPEPIKILRLYKDGEPFINPLFPEMVQEAKLTGRFGQVDTTTNGLLLNGKLIEDTIDAGLDKIFISVPERYSEEYRSRIGYLFNYSREKCIVHAKYIIHGNDQESVENFLFDFCDITDSMSVEHLAPCWPGYPVKDVDKLIGIYGQPVHEVQVCPYIFYSLAINSDGTVSLCFLDWKHEMIIGNLKTESFKDIWNGEQLRIEREFQLRQFRKGVFGTESCRDCGQLIYGQPDDIDQYADELLERMKR